jgi:hypothetical protein
MSRAEVLDPERDAIVGDPSGSFTSDIFERIA